MSKYLAPVVIFILLAGWLGIYAFGILQIPDVTNWMKGFKTVGLIVILILVAMLMVVLIQRFRELREENEDDYRKY